MTGTQQPKTPGEAIFREARGARQTSEQLLPLLSLLEEPEGAGSLTQILELLSTIVAILGQHSQSLEDIKARVGPYGPNPTGPR